MSDVAGAPESSSTLKILLIGLGAIVGLAALYFLVVSPLFLSGGEEDLSVPIPVRSEPEPGATPSPTGDDDLASGDPVPETFAVFNARDPFQQLVVADTGGTGGVAPTPGATQPPGQVTVGGTTITNVDVFTDNGEDRVLVTVNGTGYEVGVGDTFADGTMQVLDITPPCATFMFGSSRFTLCEGESIRK